MKTSRINPETSRMGRQVASLSKRVLAFCLDYLFILAMIAYLASITLAVSWATDRMGYPISFPENPIQRDMIAFTTLILPVILYFSLLESAPRGATWGKRRMGIRVVNPSGKRLTRKQAIVRSIVKFLPWQLAHTCLFHIQTDTARQEAWVIAGFILVYILIGFYLLSAILSNDKRTPYDWLASSYVVHQSS